MKITLKLVASLAGFAFSFFSSNAFAGTDSTTEWSLEPKNLFEGQAPEDISQLLQTLDVTRQAARAIEQRLHVSNVHQLAMIRFKYGYEDIWLLYRAEEKSYVAEIMLNRKRNTFSSSVSEAVPSEWNSLFNKLLGNRQKPPTPPLAAGTRMRIGEFWPQGYIGIVNVYNDGETRAYLLATEDMSTLHLQGPVDALLCSTIFSGMHCHMGAHLTEGWLLQDLNTLVKHHLPVDQSLNDLARQLGSVVDQAAPPPNHP